MKTHWNTINLVQLSVWALVWILRNSFKIFKKLVPVFYKQHVISTLHSFQFKGRILLYTAEFSEKLLAIFKKDFPADSMVKNLPAMQDTWVQSLSWEDFLEKEMATHSSILAWEIPRTEEPVGLQSWGCKRVRQDLATTQQHLQKHKTLKTFSFIFQVSQKLWKLTRNSNHSSKSIQYIIN